MALGICAWQDSGVHLRSHAQLGAAAGGADGSAGGEG